MLITVMRRLPLLLALFSVPAHAGEADALLGHWRSAEAAQAIVEIVAASGAYEGRVCAHAEDPGRIGTLVFRDLRYSAKDGHWRGRAYAPRLGRELDAEFILLAADRFTLTVSTLFGHRSVEWQRAGENVCPDLPN